MARLGKEIDMIIDVILKVETRLLLTWTTETDEGAVETVWRMQNPSRGGSDEWMMGQARVRSAGHNISDFQLTFKAKSTVESTEEFTGTFNIDDVELLVTDYCPYHPSDAEPPIGNLYALPLMWHCLAILFS